MLWHNPDHLRLWLNAMTCKKLVQTLSCESITVYFFIYIFPAPPGTGPMYLTLGYRAHRCLRLQGEDPWKQCHHSFHLWMTSSLDASSFEMPRSSQHRCVVPQKAILLAKNFVTSLKHWPRPYHHAWGSNDDLREARIVLATFAQV